MKVPMENALQTPHHFLLHHPTGGVFVLLLFPLTLLPKINVVWRCFHPFSDASTSWLPCSCPSSFLHVTPPSWNSSVWLLIGALSYRFGMLRRRLSGISVTLSADLSVLRELRLRFGTLVWHTQPTGHKPCCQSQSLGVHCIAGVVTLMLPQIRWATPSHIAG